MKQLVITWNSVAYVLRLIKENKSNETETIELCRASGQLLSKSVLRRLKNNLNFNSIHIAWRKFRHQTVFVATI